MCGVVVVARQQRKILVNVRRGVLDFAGGVCIHTTSGVASLVVALMLRRRSVSDSVPMTEELSAREKRVTLS